MNHSEDPPSLSPPPPASSAEPGTTEFAGQTTDEGKGRIFPCEGCGADLKFDIGQQHLKCPFCGYEKELDLAEDARIEEQDFHAMLEHLRELRLEEQEQGKQPAGEDTTNEVRCESCGANVVFVGTLTSSECPYCGSPIQRDDVHRCEVRVPVDAVMPFLIERDQAKQNLKDWVASLWFAPTEFQKRGIKAAFNGVYLPYWTFDTLTFNVYSGQRGEYYYVTVGTGKNKRRERRTRWYPASGRFQRFFDDVLVPATTQLETGMLQSLEPWPLYKCIPFTQEVLAGYFARTYDLELDGGFIHGKRRIDDALYREVCQRIGGDTQRVHSVDTRYDGLTYKHVLLPLWLLAYQFHDKTYQVYVNAATGEVQGQRPYSWIKITFAVLTGAAVVGGLMYLFSQS
jgi:predicted RNA-binding Zn-ribbon protein involved in translation (DUF1610 family)